MKIRNLFLIIGFSLFITPYVRAQLTDTEEFFIPGENVEMTPNKQETSSITPMMKDKIPAAILQNVLEAEQAFCYTVSTPRDGYTGYTLDGMEITGFCGMLTKDERKILIDEFLGSETNVSNTVEQCIIEPRIMLRYIRGVDYVDILLSSPCYSFSIFYGGQFISFNMSPAAPIVDGIIEALEKQKAAFVSPALLGQVLPIGVPQNEEQKELIREKSTPKAVRNWVKADEKTDTADNPDSQPAAPVRKGWNQIKFRRAN